MLAGNGAIHKHWPNKDLLSISGLRIQLSVLYYAGNYVMLTFIRLLVKGGTPHVDPHSAN